MLDTWSFEFKKDAVMDDHTLHAYQEKLLELRANYEKKFAKFVDCHFYDGELPPPNNLFAELKYECTRHEPKCKGWYLIWNPNTEKDKLNLHTLSHEQICAPTEYRQLSKSMQAELEMAFFNYFKLFYIETDLDYYKMTDSYKNITHDNMENQMETTETNTIE